MGFEGSANKLGIGIMQDNKILVNIRSTYTPETGCGFKLSDASAHHQRNIVQLYNRALKESGISIDQVDYLAYTAGPGIAPCLQVVSIFVNIICHMHSIPVVPVNHCVAHIEMGRFITGAKNPTILYVSGGNTQIITYLNGRYRIFGETLDIAIGNALDRLARMLNIPNAPSPGYNIEQMALKSSTLIQLPYSVKGMDVSFSGMISFIEKYIQNKTLTEEDKQSICYSVQETAFAMLVEVTERAMACTQSSEVLVVGGVGCNKRLQQMATEMALERNAKGYSADERYCIDNGLMIAHTAQKMIQSGYQPLDNSCYFTQRYRTDTVDITWRE
ncbi:N6-L-threonylcarbamoyladenine synthase [Nematocida sp. AWRm80]|nr:N6-L-threonylcarbamoyladenine synthase [Nematocida sp. AWRm80]